MAKTPLGMGGGIFGDASVALTAIGTTAATAATVLADWQMVDVVTSTNYGVILRAMNAGESGGVSNGDATEALWVYPPTGMKFNNQTANLQYIVPQGKAIYYTFLNATHILVVGG